MHAGSFRLQRGTAGRVVSLYTPVAYKGHAMFIYISFSKHTLSVLSAASGTKRRSFIHTLCHNSIADHARSKHARRADTLPMPNGASCTPAARQYGRCTSCRCHRRCSRQHGCYVTAAARHAAVQLKIPAARRNVLAMMPSHSVLRFLEGCHCCRGDVIV